MKKNKVTQNYKFLVLTKSKSDFLEILKIILTAAASGWWESGKATVTTTERAPDMPQTPGLVPQSADPTGYHLLTHQRSLNALHICNVS